MGALQTKTSKCFLLGIVLIESHKKGKSVLSKELVFRCNGRDAHLSEHPPSSCGVDTEVFLGACVRDKLPAVSCTHPLTNYGATFWKLIHTMRTVVLAPKAEERIKWNHLPVAYGT